MFSLFSATSLGFLFVIVGILTIFVFSLIKFFQYTGNVDNDQQASMTNIIVFAFMILATGCCMIAATNGNELLAYIKP